MNTLPKLGKLPPKHDPRTLKLANYFISSLPQAPDKYSWSRKASNWGMMLNDKIGDCAIAAPGHMIQAWTANCGNQIIIPDDQILNAYSLETGYDPKTGDNDNGCVEINVLNRWRNLGISNHKIEMYAQVNLNNHDHTKLGIYLFGGLYAGVALPVSAQNQDIWDNTFGPDAEKGSWGGHAVYIIDYDRFGPTCVTWGALKKMSWEFFFKYFDEAYVIISTDFFVNDKTPILVDMDTMKKDLAAL